MRPLILTLCLLLAPPACTVAPKPVDAAHASFDNGEANSGILALESGGAVVTERVVLRYRALLDQYQKSFLPKVDFREGVKLRPDGTWFVDNGVLDRLILMAEWKRMGKLAVP